MSTNDTDMTPVPDITSSLAGKNIFITGATGFVGLALVEKLLRKVPDIGLVFLLIRPKRDKLIHARLQEIMNSSIFDHMKEILSPDEVSRQFDKLRAVTGSVDKENLGLDPNDSHLLTTQSDYVFHCAASLDFEASMRTAVEVNLLGTRRIVELCSKMQHLQALVHVSSAYVNSDKLEVLEKLYDPPANVNTLLELVNSKTDESLQRYVPSILQKHPNCYTLTKALAEHEVVASYGKFPSCIVRPSMIVGAWKEPAPGWTNSKNGPQGFIMGASMGVVRRLPVAKNLIYDYIPVDVVINSMIVAGVHIAHNHQVRREIPIYHVTSSTLREFRWACVEDKMTELLNKYPVAQAVWYPHLKLVSTMPRYWLAMPLFHLLPAILFDTFARVTGGRPKLMRLHSSINNSLQRLAPFIFTQWSFPCGKLDLLQKSMNEKDKVNFEIDISTLNWPNFFEDLALGVRRYLIKEKDDTLPKARSKAKLLSYANVAVQILLLVLVWYFFTLVLGLSTPVAAVLFSGFLFLFLNL